MFTEAIQENLAGASEMRSQGMQAGMSRIGSMADDCLEDLRTDFVRM